MKQIYMMFYFMLCAVALAWGLVIIAEDFEQYKKESACVKKFVAIGVERASIATELGDCHLIKEDK